MKKAFETRQIFPFEVPIEVMAVYDEDDVNIEFLMESEDRIIVMIGKEDHVWQLRNERWVHTHTWEIV